LEREWKTGSHCGRESVRKRDIRFRDASITT